MKDSKIKEYLSSKEACKSLKIKGCELMHLREEGKLEFIKKGNAYLYEKESLKSVIK
ncbi:hypothetical protein [uncultured Aquimarina sp.]|uniref:hypothetical protein n=1 Tax=uncultured Aquimarina sp. TaxID=575652 RepID=UPI0026210AB7|nr:hypothetical protein [uncultured Aquimarina sp.]